MSAAPGWYDDGSGRQRWWDGQQWTEHYAPPPPPRSAPTAPAATYAANVRYETKTIQYIPGRRIGLGGQAVMDKHLRDGREIVTEKHRFGAATTATLRRPKP